MGSHASCLVAGIYSEKTIQVVCSDGTVRNFHRIVSAGQIMLEFPDYLVCHSDSLYIGQKTLAFSENDQLKVGNKYFVLPNHFFQSPLSFVTLASLISPTVTNGPVSPTARVSAPLRSIGREVALCQPFQIENSNVGGDNRIRLYADFMTKIMDNGKLNSNERGNAVVGDFADDGQHGLCNTPELHKDYAQLAKAKGQSWKPELETVRENGRNGVYMRFIKGGDQDRRALGLIITRAILTAVF